MNLSVIIIIIHKRKPILQLKNCICTIRILIMITNHPLVDIYADEGVTGTREDKREEFQSMMQDCRKGKIDA